jgi:hypothetical protein
MTAIPGVTVAGLADLNSARLAAAAAALRLPANACFTDATEMVTTLGPLISCRSPRRLRGKSRWDGRCSTPASSA